MFGVSPEQIVIVYAMVEVIRAWFPSAIVRLDGRLRVWILVAVASAIVVGQGAATPDNTEDVLYLLRDIATLTVASVLANGAVVASQLQNVVRSVTTFGGRLTVDGSAASGDSS